MPTGGVQHLLTIAPAPDSARTARRFVAEVLATARADHFTDTAALLTSELVTNGIVHAHTEMQLLVEATPTWVRVEVVDGNPMLPSRRGYDESATTGRGLEMVELLADDYGFELLEDDGKRCWFRLGEAPGTPAEADPVAGAAGEHGHPPMTVLLGNLPVTLYCAWQQHAEALLREATLVALEQPGPARADFSVAAQALGALAESAHEIFALRDEGHASADVTVQLPPDASTWFPILRELLAEATLQAERNRLLVPPSLPELVELRNWVCDEVARQAAGLEPTSWTATPLRETQRLAVAEETLREVRMATAAVIAADAANCIVAVSDPAARLLGWDGGELEGRRLVTIIPPRMRDAHIAAYTRRLLGAGGTILDREVELMALRRDGTEIPVTLFVQRRSDPATHALFIGTLIPREADGSSV